MNSRQQSASPITLEQRFAGMILGTAAGDALGLPREGISRRRAARLFPPPLRHRLVFGRGMLSDDTEHACMTIQAIIRANGDVEAFRRSLAWRLRWWLLCIPAGVGLATLRSIGKLWIGISPARSGVWSAGNGPAMRAAAIGAAFANDRESLVRHLEASTLMTHRDPRAFRGALLVALAAAACARGFDDDSDADRFLAEAVQIAPDDHELIEQIEIMRTCLGRDASAVDFACAIGATNGVSGYIYQTVPVCLYCWLRTPTDFAMAMRDVIELGGDTDSTAAIVGALIGTNVGVDAIPKTWIDGIVDYPRSVRWMRRLADAMVEWQKHQAPTSLPRMNQLFVPVRNTVFLGVVLAHGVRRLLPPY